MAELTPPYAPRRIRRFDFVGEWSGVVDEQSRGNVLDEGTPVGWFWWRVLRYSYDFPFVSGVEGVEWLVGCRLFFNRCRVGELDWIGLDWCSS